MNLPPGVSPSDPHLTGEYPCSFCGGVGGDFDEDGGHSCWMCGGSGVHPEDPPECPKCGEGGQSTDWFDQLEPVDLAAVLAHIEEHGEETVKEIDYGNVVYCHACGEVSR